MKKVLFYLLASVATIVLTYVFSRVCNNLLTAFFDFIYQISHACPNTRGPAYIKFLNFFVYRDSFFGTVIGSMLALMVVRLVCVERPWILVVNFHLCNTIFMVIFGLLMQLVDSNPASTLMPIAMAMLIGHLCGLAWPRKLIPELF